MSTAPKGYAHIFDSRIEWGDLWFRPCDGVWVEVGAALVGRCGSNPSTVCARKIQKKFDKPLPVCEILDMTKLYNIGAYGIPARLLWCVQSWSLNLTWTVHAQSEATSLVRHFGFSAFAFPKKFITGNGWEVVELEATESNTISKVVARRPIDGTKWSLVLVIKPNGVVKTCWANLTSDTHRTLNLSKYSEA